MKANPWPIRRRLPSLDLLASAAGPMIGLSALFVVFVTTPALAGPPHEARDKFEQLGQELPTPNVYRTASGDAGHEYWQQKVDYDIDVTLDEAQNRVIGKERIRYENRSPDRLSYLWVQLEQNIFRPDSGSVLTETTNRPERLSYNEFKSTLAQETFDGGYQITSVTSATGTELPHLINDTMMRVDLPAPLSPGETFVVDIGWNYRVNDADVLSARTGYETLEKDGHKVYEIAHWYPRLAAYTDYTGWQHKQFLGSGEFTLEFGNYDVRITAPDDHVVAATGTLQNPETVLSETQRQRLEEAKTAAKPVMIVNADEAAATRKAVDAKVSNDKPATKTWRFHADNVRDFAWASSRTFLWDAQGHTVPADSPADVDQHVVAMSYFPIEGEPLWSKYSTASIIHTLMVYSKYTFKYPYPIAISVNGPIGGMEYPMICFNGPRPEKDGTYSDRTKYGLISVIIHEVGHNYFPMIVNSDERQWTWMDEGLNTFCQYLAEQEWEKGYPSYRGQPANIAGYMLSGNQVPIMSNSESLLQFGNNAYAKPATALNILRETVLGREKFDFAFKTYARRWQFKRPTPSDFFRTMEDASGTDLDWFWRAWFYTTDHVDLALTGVELFNIDTGDPETVKSLRKADQDAQPKTLSQQRNEALPKAIDQKPELRDFYNEQDEFAVRPAETERYQKFLKDLSEEEKAMLRDGRNFYLITVSNLGGIVMPVILEFEYEDGTTDELRIPAEIWRKNSEKISKLVIKEKNVVRVTVDPHLEIADTDTSNNQFPPKLAQSRFELFKAGRRGGGTPNLMRTLRDEEAAAKKAAEEKAKQEQESQDAKPGGPGDTKAEDEPASKGAAEVQVDPQATEGTPTKEMTTPTEPTPPPAKTPAELETPAPTAPETPPTPAPATAAPASVPATPITPAVAPAPAE